MVAYHSNKNRKRSKTASNISEKWFPCLKGTKEEKLSQPGNCIALAKASSCTSCRNVAKDQEKIHQNPCHHGSLEPLIAFK